jgi:hypothetical protein
MQKWWRDWALARARSEPQPVDDPGDFGFYNEAGIREWGIEYLDSNRHPGHLPKPGGMLAQTSMTRHDLRLVNHLLAWGQWDVWRTKKDEEDLKKMGIEDYTR